MDLKKRLDAAEWCLEKILDWAEYHGHSYIEDLIKEYYEETHND